ncbi:nucleoplasmin-like protein ANO39 isoform X1 [Asterias rubens]|uniref:nucleoplasmin-like protein ANO39 isoform X1 n=1 Tax=Asterias rubens TaxID=7604 RepID=UPI00145554D7|nr:nucleoplasmin-like protein ANO39 isoform X1 [Asterias rubens]
MSKEYFWGDELSGSKKDIKWNPSFEDDDDDDIDIEGIQHFLFLKQAVLGANAEEGERNVVEITTENFEGDDVKQPLFSLKLGLNESSILDIAIQPPVTLSLVSGTGPVYLSGQHMIEISADDDDDEDEMDEEDFETKINPDNIITNSKKRQISTSESIAKKMKLSKEEQNDDDDDDDDDDDVEEVDEEMPVMEELDDDDDEEDDEDFEGEEEEEDEEDSDDDEEDEEEEEDEDEESPAKPVKKVKGMKGKMNGTATAKGDNKKTKEATKSVTKPKGKKKTVGLDEIKKKIQEVSGKSNYQRYHK